MPFLPDQPGTSMAVTASPTSCSPGPDDLVLSAHGTLGAFKGQLNKSFRVHGGLRRDSKSRFTGGPPCYYSSISAL
jgi:hypothetical protein